MKYLVMPVSYFCFICIYTFYMCFYDVDVMCTLHVIIEIYLVINVIDSVILNVATDISYFS